MERFRACLGDLVDPRTGNAQRHDLLEMLLIALAATLSGAATCVDMALFGQAKEPSLRRFVRLEGGVPSHDTFSRLFRLLDPGAFEASFGCFVAAFATQVGAAEAASGQVVAVDGKTARRSFDHREGRRPLHMVNTWAVEQRLGAAQGRWRQQPPSRTTPAWLAEHHEISWPSPRLQRHRHARDRRQDQYRRAPLSAAHQADRH